MMGGEWRDAMRNDKKDRQTEAKVLEVEAGGSVQRELGGNAHRHMNVIMMNDKNEILMDVDSVVVHVGGQDVANSAAYVVEAAQSPQPREVDVLLRKVERFKKLTPTNVHFKKSCRTFVPMLADRNWPNETLSLCRSLEGCVDGVPVWWRLHCQQGNVDSLETVQIVSAVLLLGGKTYKRSTFVNPTSIIESFLYMLYDDVVM